MLFSILINIKVINNRTKIHLNIMAKFIAVLNNQRLFKVAQNDMQKIYFLKIRKLPKTPKFNTVHDENLKREDDAQTDI
jgi:hypothetical protein